MVSSSVTSLKPCSVGTPLRYLIGLPLGSWIMRNETASSVETAGQSLTGIRTRERRRLPDQSEGGGISTRTQNTTNESESGLAGCPSKRNKARISLGGPVVRATG